MTEHSQLIRRGGQGPCPAPPPHGSHLWIQPGTDYPVRCGGHPDPATCPHPNRAFTVGGPGDSDGYVWCPDCRTNLTAEAEQDGGHPDPATTPWPGGWETRGHDELRYDGEFGVRFLYRSDVGSEGFDALRAAVAAYASRAEGWTVCPCGGRTHPSHPCDHSDAPAADTASEACEPLDTGAQPGHWHPTPTGGYRAAGRTCPAADTASEDQP